LDSFPVTIDREVLLEKAFTVSFTFHISQYHSKFETLTELKVLDDRNKQNTWLENPNSFDFTIHRRLSKPVARKCKQI